MKPLYLHVEDGSGIHVDAVVLLDVFCQAYLVLVLDIHKLLLTSLVVGVNLQLLHVGQVGDPVVTDLVGHPVSQQRIAVEEETSLSNTVGLIVELLGHHLIEILQLLLLQDLRVKLCHAVYRKAAHDGHISHAHLSVVDDGHTVHLARVIGVSLLYLGHEAAVDFLHDLIDSGKQTGEQLDGPFLQGLSHNGVVGVSAGSGGDIPGLIPA